MKAYDDYYTITITLSERHKREGGLYAIDIPGLETSVFKYKNIEINCPESGLLKRVLEMLSLNEIDELKIKYNGHRSNL